MEDPLAFVMPFGQYKGQTLKQVLSTQKGIEYVRWAATHPAFKHMQVKAACKRALRASQL